MSEYEDQEFEHANPDYDGGESKGHPPKKVSSIKKEAQDAVGSFIGGNLQNVLPFAMTVLDKLEDVYQVTVPIMYKFLAVYNQVWNQLKPYGPEEIMTCVTGVVMMFFGGSFATLTAVWEAINQGGLEDLKTNLAELMDQYHSFRSATRTDDQIDADNDGIADVKQISAEQYAVRKTLVALKSTDPEVISRGFQNLYTIFIAVVATLRLRFARTISLGASIGDQLSQVYIKFVVPQLKKFIEDTEYHKWLSPVGLYICRFIGVSIAFRIQRILTTVHTAVKGARILTRGLTQLAEKNGYGYLTEGYLDEALSAGMAAAGIVLQLFMWSSVPIVIQLMFFPFFMLEGILSMFVSVGLSFTTPTTATP